MQKQRAGSKRFALFLAEWFQYSYYFCFLFSAVISNKPGHKRLFISALPLNELAAFRKEGDDRITNKPCFDSFWGFQVDLQQVLT